MVAITIGSIFEQRNQASPGEQLRRAVDTLEPGLPKVARLTMSADRKRQAPALLMAS